MVKDLRTGVETSDTAGVLDGDLDEFLQASLSAEAGTGNGGGGLGLAYRGMRPDDFYLPRKCPD
jgi:hypothetical protein